MHMKCFLNWIILKAPKLVKRTDKFQNSYVTFSLILHRHVLEYIGSTCTQYYYLIE